MTKPIINRRVGGEFSTIVMGNMVETMWFGDDGSQINVSRSILPDVADIARVHIAEYEARS